MWDANLRVVAHLYAGHALEILEHMRASDAWKAGGLFIGSPVYQLATNRSTGIWTLQNKMELLPDRTQELFEFLITQEKSLEHISIRDDKEEAEKALGKVYRLIAAYGRKIREGKQDSKLPKVSQKIVRPTTLPKGSYFTIPQAAEICNITSKQIRAWIRKHKLEAFVCIPARASNNQNGFEITKKWSQSGDTVK